MDMNYSANPPALLLVGTQMDLAEDPSYKESADDMLRNVELFQRMVKIAFYPTSARTFEGIKDLATVIVGLCRERQDLKLAENKNKVQILPPVGKKEEENTSCCFSFSFK